MVDAVGRLVLIETYKPSLLVTARGLICNSEWTAERVQRNITSLRRGKRGCEGEKVVIRRKKSQCFNCC